jgi:hypothetical protein
MPIFFVAKLRFKDTFQAVMDYFICHEVMPTTIYNNWTNYGGHNYVSKPPKKMRAPSFLENLVLLHHTLPFKSSFSGMGRVSFHHTLIVVEGNATTPPSWLPKWNGTHAIPPYIDHSEREFDNANFLIAYVEGESCHSTIHWQ